jgi:hypothetical protein
MEDDGKGRESLRQTPRAPLATPFSDSSGARHALATRPIHLYVRFLLLAAGLNSLPQCKNFLFLSSSLYYILPSSLPSCLIPSTQLQLMASPSSSSSPLPVSQDSEGKLLGRTSSRPPEFYYPRSCQISYYNTLIDVLLHMSRQFANINS